MYGTHKSVKVLMVYCSCEALVLYIRAEVLYATSDSWFITQVLSNAAMCYYSVRGAVTEGKTAQIFLSQVALG